MISGKAMSMNADYSVGVDGGISGEQMTGAFLSRKQSDAIGSGGSMMIPSNGNAESVQT
jgi:hypothetical protein